MNKWNFQIRKELETIRKEQKKLCAVNNECVEELKHVKRHRHEMKKKHHSNHSNQRTRDG